MNSLLIYLAGKKTYVLAFAGGVYAVLIGLGILPNSETVWGLLGAGTVAALRAGVAKIGQPMLLAGAIGLAALAPGCATPETAAYRTIGTAATAVDTAMNYWGDRVHAGKTTPDQEITVRKLYGDYQAAMKVAQDVVNAYRAAGKDAGAPSALQTALDAAQKASDDVVAFISQVTGKRFTP